MTLHPTMNNPAAATHSTSSKNTGITTTPNKIEKRRGRPRKITSPLNYPVKWQFLKEDGDVKKHSKNPLGGGGDDMNIVNCYDMFRGDSCTSSTSSQTQTTSTNTDNSPIMISQNTITKSKSAPLLLNNSSTTTSTKTASNCTTTTGSNAGVGSSCVIVGRRSSITSYSEPPSPCTSMDSYFLTNSNSLPSSSTVQHSSPHYQQQLSTSTLQHSPIVYPTNVYNTNHPQQCTATPSNDTPTPQQQLQQYNAYLPPPIQTSQFSTPTKKQVLSSSTTTVSPKSIPSPNSSSSSVYHSWKVDLSAPSNSLPYQKHGERSFSLNDTIQVNSTNYKISMTSKKPSPPKVCSQNNINNSTTSSSIVFMNHSTSLKNETQSVTVQEGVDDDNNNRKKNSSEEVTETTQSTKATSKGRSCMPSLKDIFN